MRLYISKKSIFRRDKITPFECGFDPISSRDVRFFIRFYLFSLIFLIFDVEIILLFPIIELLKENIINFFSVYLFIYFIFILILGLLIEYLDRSLEWRIYIESN